MTQIEHVVGHVVHDIDYTFVNVAGEERNVTKGVWSVLSCRAGHIVAGDLPLGDEVECVQCETV